MRKLMLSALLTAVLAILGTSVDAAVPIATKQYSCANDKSLTAAYYDGRVELGLSDGRKLKLPQSESASGVRYANADESVVFWSKGKTAFMTEGPVTSYADCSEVAN